MSAAPALVRDAAHVLHLDRRTVAPLRLRFERRMLARRRHLKPPRPRVLAYHGVGTPSVGVNDLAPARFRAQMLAALAAGYAFAPLAEVVGAAPDEALLAVTFDDGLSSVAANAAPVLADLGIPWTMFVVAGWAGGAHPLKPDEVLDWDGLARLTAAGDVTIGSHSLTHPDFARLPSERVREELEGSRRLIAERLGTAPVDFAIPWGTARHWPEGATAAARAAGYERIHAQVEGRRPPGTIGRSFVTRYDDLGTFDAMLAGAFDEWEEWS